MSWLKAAKLIVDFEAEVLLLPWWVVFWTPQYLVITSLLRRKMPTLKIVFLCHNVIGHESRWFVRSLSRLTLARGDAFLVQSAEEHRNLKHWFPYKPIEIAEHPAYDDCSSTLPSQALAQQALGISGRVLLFFGFVRHYKGLDVLLRAMPEIVNAEPCTLVVAGEMWEDKRAYTDLITSLELESNVNLVDNYIPQADVETYFRAADLVVLPYRSVTGSGVVKLAYSFGRPVVVSNVGSMDQVVDEGLSGYLVPTENPRGLAECVINHLLHADQEKMNRAAASKGQQYTWSAVVDSLEKLFHVEPIS